jgi:hypothetical protein
MSEAVSSFFGPAPGAEGRRACCSCPATPLAALTGRPADLVEVGETEIRGRRAVAKLWSVERVSDPPEQ